MLIAMDPSETREYILQEDRESPEPTKFYLKPLDAKTAAKIKDRLVLFEATPEGEVKVSPGLRFNAFELFLDVVKLGLVDWNLKYRVKTGEVLPAPFKREKMHSNIYGYTDFVTEETLNYLKPLWIQELATAIVGESFLSAEKEKNSVGP